MKWPERILHRTPGPRSQNHIRTREHKHHPKGKDHSLLRDTSSLNNHIIRLEIFSKI